MQRVINKIKKEGIFKTIKWIFKGVLRKTRDFIMNHFNKIKNSGKYKTAIKELDDIIDNSDYDRIIIWRGSFGWSVRLFQRPQHLANSLSKKKTLFFYEVTYATDKINFIHKQKDNLYLINFGFKRFSKYFNKKLSKVDKPKYNFVSSTCWDHYLEKLMDEVDGISAIYDYLDDINPVLAGTYGIPKCIEANFKYAINNRDKVITTCTASVLYENFEEQAKSKKNLHLVTNGVLYEHFVNLKKDYKFEESFKKILKEGKPIVCYYGALASWFDYNLIKKLAKENPNINIILIGLKYDDSYDREMKKHPSNIHYIGSKTFDDLPYYAAKADVYILPFLINDITKATNPIKIFEYMALGKPIVSTNIPECHKYKSVMIGKTDEEFISLVKKSINLKDDKYYKTLNKEALANTWDSKADEILKGIKEYEKNSKETAKESL